MAVCDGNVQCIYEHAEGGAPMLAGTGAGLASRVVIRHVVPKLVTRDGCS